LSFEDLIEYSEEFLQRKTPHPKDDLSWDPHVRNRFEQFLHTEEKWTIRKVGFEPRTKSSPLSQTIPAEDSQARKALGNFAWGICGLPQVESVSIFRSSDDVFNVSTIITGFNIEAERKIAHAEAELLRNNPTLRLDFSVISSRGRKVSDLLPIGSEVLYSKKK